MPYSLVHLLLILFRVAKGRIVDNFDAFWRADKFMFFFGVTPKNSWNIRSPDVDQVTVMLR